MQVLELLSLITLALVSINIFQTRPRAPRWLYWAALGLVALHLIVEGYRWQMVPAYLLVTAISLPAVVRAFVRRGTEKARNRAPRLVRLAGGMAACLSVVLSAALAALFPMFELPAPTGPHAVGRTTFHLTDAAREEPFTPAGSDRRELMVQVWYPAEPVPGAAPARYIAGGLRALRALARSLDLPPFLFDHLARIRAHAVAEAPVAEDARGDFPVLVYSHGYGAGFASQNTVLMEELASRGYAVFSIAHPYEAAAVAYPDGRVVPPEPRQYATWMAEAEPLFSGWMASRGTLEERDRWQRVMAWPLANRSLRLWTDDTRFVLDEIERLQTGTGPYEAHPLAGRLDLGRLGALGMSFGGSTAGQIILEDPRVKAGVNLDGAMFGEASQRSLGRPFLIMSSADSPGLFDPVFAMAAGPAYHADIAGARHFDYSDLGLWSPLFKWVGLLGPIPADTMLEYTSRYTVAFFDRHLRGIETPLLAGEEIIPAVSWRSRDRDSVASTVALP